MPAGYREREPLPDVCWTMSGYKGTLPYDTEYLGFKQLGEYPIVTMAARLKNEDEAADLIHWWETLGKRGTNIWVYTGKLFAKLGVWDLRQIAPFVHTVNDGIHKISFTAEVVANEEVKNNPPKAISTVVNIETDSTDNFIKLKGIDPDGDFLNYEIYVPPRIDAGKLEGTPPNLKYTPVPGYKGTDCFSFKVIDKYGQTDIGVVEIHTDTGVLPSFVAEYTVPSTGVRMAGNYWWNDGVSGWKRGTGGYIMPNTSVDPNNNTVTVASMDNFIDDRDKDKVTKINILSFGERKNFTDFAALPNLTTISIDNNAGECKAEVMDRMFFGSGIEQMPPIETKNVKSFESMFEGSKIKSLPTMDVSEGLNFRRMFAETKHLQAVAPINSAKGEIFREMFLNTSAKCLGGIDTRMHLDTGDMFTGSAFTNPSTADQSKIMGGADWHSKVSCGAQIISINKIGGTETCEVGTFEKACKSEGTYKATIKSGSALGTLTWSWKVQNATIKSGQGTDTVVVESAASVDPMSIKLEATVHDAGAGGATTSSGWVSMQHKRTYEYAILHLPVHHGRLDLAKYIRSKTSKKDVLVINNNIIPSVQYKDTVGDLNVKFINNGEIQAYSRADGQLYEWESVALDIKSPLLLINNGWIRGCGGHGGHGGKGADDTYTTTHYKWVYKTMYASPSCHPGSASYFAVQNTSVLGQWSYVWGGKKKPYANGLSPSSWVTIPGLPGEYKVDGGVKKRLTCGSPVAFHAIQRRIWTKYTITHDRTGGAGGKGGRGMGYGMTANDPRRNAEKGKPSNPPGGFSGGVGGYGAFWGLSAGDNNGTYDGAPGGGCTIGSNRGCILPTAAMPAGDAMWYKDTWLNSYLKPGSKIGNVNGATI